MVFEWLHSKETSEQTGSDVGGQSRERPQVSCLSFLKTLVTSFSNVSKDKAASVSESTGAKTAVTEPQVQD